jgi:hypothetical protein
MSRHFDTTPPAVRACPVCQRPLLHGLAEGLLARADPVPVDPAAERQALDAGRWTYTLRRTGLIHRDPDRRADPTLAAPVVAAHACPGRRERGLW